MNPAWFILPPIVLTAATAVFLWVPAAVLPAWWVWVWLVEGPHLVATWMRTYADAEERRTRTRLLGASLLWFLPGIAAFAATKLSGQERIFAAFLGFAALWSWHHTLRQNFGIASILNRYAGAAPKIFRIDKWFIPVSGWLMFAVTLLTNPINRRILDLPSELTGAWLLAAWTLGVVLASVLVAYSAHAAWRVATRTALVPALFTLVTQGFMYVCAFFVFGRREPLLPGASGPEQLFAASVIAGGVVHGVQYLCLYFFLERRRSAQTERSRWLDSLGRSPALTWIVFALISTLYALLSAARGDAPGVSLFGRNSDPARLALAFYWGLFFHHYYLDQHIWRPHQDARLRREFGFV